MKLITILCAILLTTVCHAHNSPSPEEQQKAIEAIVETNKRVREAFLKQDIPKILRYHHPKVEKALGWDNYQRGHGDMTKALKGLFADYTVEFFSDDSTPLESLEVFGETAVMIRKFKLKGIPKREELNEFVFQGRSLIVYLRNDSSPTGWVTVREMLMEPDEE